MFSCMPAHDVGLDLAFNAAIFGSAIFDLHDSGIRRTLILLGVEAVLKWGVFNPHTLYKSYRWDLRISSKSMTHFAWFPMK